MTLASNLCLNSSSVFIITAFFKKSSEFEKVDSLLSLKFLTVFLTEGLRGLLNKLLGVKFFF